MPVTARKNMYQPGSEGILHCWSRVALGAFLFGKDPDTGKDYSHRRPWFYQRLDVLCQAFGIDILFFALLANHFHIVLAARPRLIKRLGTREVARRWLLVFPGKQINEGDPPEPTEQQIDALVKNKKKMKEIRKRLCDVSWFMKALKEPIARRANKESNNKGAFFDGRFKARRVEDVAGLLIVGLYTDLNPYRAGECDIPWESDHCSAGRRFGRSLSPPGGRCGVFAPTRHRAVRRSSSPEHRAEHRHRD